MVENGGKEREKLLEDERRMGEKRRKKLPFCCWAASSRVDSRRVEWPSVRPK